jgi:hypothetical protein
MDTDDEPCRENTSPCDIERKKRVLCHPFYISLV